MLGRKIGLFPASVVGLCFLVIVHYVWAFVTRINILLFFFCPFLPRSSVCFPSFVDVVIKAGFFTYANNVISKNASGFGTDSTEALKSDYRKKDVYGCVCSRK